MKNQLSTTSEWARLRRSGAIAATTLSLIALAACGGSDAPVADEPGDGEPAQTQAYELTLTNLTAGQPLSPAVVVVHDNGYGLFRIGSPATVGLERLAEGAETEPLLAELAGQSAVKASATSPGGPIGPGASGTFMVDVPMPAGSSPALQISLVSMLVNTNDAIAALNGRELSALATGESMSVNLISYDTGTEDNTETMGSMPGPAAGGEGFNASRNDLRDAVHVHAGVITSDDGLSASALGSIHRWEHPVARLLVRRVR